MYDYVYNDTNEVYDRPPYIASFYIQNSGLSINKFILGNVHLRPTHVLSEALELRNVIDSIKKSEPNLNMAVIGDFNMDCSYISQANRNKVYSDLSDSAWYIRDKYPTTLSKTSTCAYDRIMVTGSQFNKAIVPNSNQTYTYYNDFRMDTTEVFNLRVQDISNIHFFT